MNQSEPPTCPKCSHPMDEGTIGESEGIHYASNRQTGFLKVMTPARWARACMTCGYIELYLDPRELRQKIGM
ncbi:MAG: hypothetical protein HPY76_02145 [Anaerolineae bacterium]|nr:hypothetical protein [Anaerolineae bacterium]